MVETLEEAGNTTMNTPTIDLRAPGVPPVTPEPVIQLTPSQMKEMMQTYAEEIWGSSSRGQDRPIIARPEVSPLRPRQIFGEGRSKKDQSKKGKGEQAQLTHSDEGESKAPKFEPKRNLPTKRMGQNPPQSVEEIGDSEQAEMLEQQLKRMQGRLDRGTTMRKKGSPFCSNILAATIPKNFMIPDLPKYDGSTDPQAHIAIFEEIVFIYGQSEEINCRLLVRTFKEQAQEWWLSLLAGTVIGYEQLCRKFMYHFGCKKKPKRSAMHLFHVRQGEGETLKEFINRFNDERLGVQGLNIEMITSCIGFEQGTFSISFIDADSF